MRNKRICCFLGNSGDKSKNILTSFIANIKIKKSVSFKARLLSLTLLGTFPHHPTWHHLSWRCSCIYSPLATQKFLAYFEISHYVKEIFGLTHTITYITTHSMPSSRIRVFFFLKLNVSWSSRHGTAEMNLTRNRKVNCLLWYFHSQYSSFYWNDVYWWVARLTIKVCPWLYRFSHLLKAGTFLGFLSSSI